MARILIIDDDAHLRSALAAGLEAAGHIVEQAEDGRAGTAHFRAEPADLVITDLVMPNQEGIETILTLRREFPDVRIIAMSGSARNSALYLELARTLGAARVLEKPFTRDRLLQAVADALATPGPDGTGK